ncbi:PREDICTED: uncharacterized protein LOC107358206 [Acropora digitifera]|uniref:uncharacterized protein LOC107358206 n=1 Tax=Acropora digitifera TaxID=70779 RepID=UPI00077AF97F|nr:PREDICTED: uncharacterized protein LOC107358206 [Acropora digitifera]
MASAAKVRILPFGYAVFRRPTTALVNFCCRYWSTCPTLNAGKKIRVSRGQAGDGIAYGALTDLPDWSYADGTPAPETKRRKIRRFRRLDVAPSSDSFGYIKCTLVIRTRTYTKYQLTCNI